MFVALCAFAQTNATDAAIDGYVQDASGGYIAGAKIVARSVETNIESTTTTNELGYYRFPLLRIGEYEVVVTSPGFAEYKRTGVVLSVGRQVRLDVALKVGAASDSVTVSADAAIVEPGTAAIEEVVNQKAVRALPLVSRNIYNFHLLGPGVKGVPSNTFGTTQFLFGGSSRATWSVDGLDNTSRSGSRQIRLIINTAESVQEMQVVSSTYSAEFGRAAGGLVNTISRSGTNQYHGSALVLQRPNSIVARSPLAATKAAYAWEDYAFNLAGPIKKDRLFFFANYEYNPYTAPNPITITPANATALKLAPEDLGASRLGETFHTPSGKLNFKLNDKNLGFVRYSRFTNHQPTGAGGGLTANSRLFEYDDRMNGGSAQLATLVSPAMLNEFRMGVNTRSVLNTPIGKGFAGIDISSVATFGANPTGGSATTETSTQLIDNVSWTRNKHTLKAGVDFQTTSYSAVTALDRRFVFSGLAAAGGRPAVTPLDQYLRTVAGTADPATAKPYMYTQVVQEIGDPALTLPFRFVNMFLQDEMRLRPNFSMNIGARYELMLFPVLDDQAPFPLSRRINNDTNNWAVRTGFSWNPRSSSKTVVRGGYGIYYDSPSLNLAVNGAQVNGRRVLGYTVPGTDARAPLFPNLLASADPSFTTPPNITAFPSDFQVMYAHQANVQVERELMSNFALNLQYQWSSHRHAPFRRDINLSAPTGTLADGRPVFRGALGRPDTRFRQINLVETGSNSNYNALDITLLKRFSSGLQFSTTYSWSHALSDSDLEGGSITDPSNRRRDYGNSNGDVRHTWVLQSLFAPRYSQDWAKWINGFELSAMTFFNSGFPINVTAGPDLNNDLVLNDRPLFLGRNMIAGPTLFQLDLRLARRFVFRDRWNVEGIAESENLPNHLNANCATTGCTGAVVARDGAADFGRITATRPGRRIQFGFRLSF
jgi:hypothetical protein